jgi:hypothetical protein
MSVLTHNFVQDYVPDNMCAVTLVTDVTDNMCVQSPNPNARSKDSTQIRSVTSVTSVTKT